MTARETEYIQSILHKCVRSVAGVESAFLTAADKVLFSGFLTRSARVLAIAQWYQHSTKTFLLSPEVSLYPNK